MFLPNPWLLGLGLLGIISPFLIHLMMRQRRVKKVFSSLRLIEECHRVSKHRKRIKNWPLFLLRILLIILLALLFGKPLLSDKLDSGQKKATVFVVDASASMNVKGPDGNAWSQVTDLLNTHLDNMHQDSEVCVIRTDDSSKEVSPWVTPPQAMDSISQWENGANYDSSSLIETLRKAVTKVGKQKGEYPVEIHIIGDLQKSSLDEIQQVKLPDSVIIKVTQVGTLWSNGYSITADSAGSDMRRRGVYAIRAQDTTDVTISGEEKPASINGEDTISVDYLAEEPGWHKRTIKLDKNDDFSLDNEIYDSYYTQSNVDVLVVDPEMGKKVFERRTFFASRSLAPLTADIQESDIKGLTRFRVKTIGLPDLEVALDSASSDSIVFLPDLSQISASLSNKLEAYIREGGGIILFGGPDLNVDIWNASLIGISPVTLNGKERTNTSTPLPSISREHALWGDFSTINRDKIRRSSLSHKHTLTVNKGAQILARYADESPLVVLSNIGKGTCVFVNTTIDQRWNDWPQIPEFFVPTMHEIASIALPKGGAKERNAQNLYHSSQQSIDIPLEGANPGIKVLLNDKEYTVSENHTIRDAVLPKPGFYSITTSDEKTLKILAVNTDPSEGVAEFFSEQEFQSLLETRRISATQGDKQTIHRAEVLGSGIPWKIILLVLLLFLIIEPFIANRS